MGKYSKTFKRAHYATAATAAAAVDVELNKSV